jgi:hypothetical protein
MPTRVGQSDNNPSQNERSNQLELFTPNEFRGSIYDTPRARNREREFQATNTEYRNLADRYKQRPQVPQATPINYGNVKKQLRTIIKSEISDAIVTVLAPISTKTQKRMRTNKLAREQLANKNITEEKITMLETVTKNYQDTTNAQIEGQSTRIEHLQSQVSNLTEKIDLLLCHVTTPPHSLDTPRKVKVKQTRQRVSK